MELHYRIPDPGRPWLIRICALGGAVSEARLIYHSPRLADPLALHGEATPQGCSVFEFPGAPPYDMVSGGNPVVVSYNLADDPIAIAFRAAALGELPTGPGQNVRFSLVVEQDGQIIGGIEYPEGGDEPPKGKAFEGPFTHLAEPDGDVTPFTPALVFRL